MLDDVTKAAVTGAAGFIGREVCKKLTDSGIAVVAIDNFSSGAAAFQEGIDQSKMKFYRADCAEDSLHMLGNVDVVFHLSANAEVRSKMGSSSAHFKDDILATHRVLEFIRRKPRIQFVFTSSSVVYGEAKVVPTPEDYAPLEPISVYGGAKLACEAMISSYARFFHIDSTIFRLGNVVGPGATRGVVIDFVRNLNKNPRELLVLGDGKQQKSYVHIDDCVRGILSGTDRSRGPLSIFNVASNDSIDVVTIARLVADMMNLRPRLSFSTGIDNGRGWAGDVRRMQLDITKLKSLGWSPVFNSSGAIKDTVNELSRMLRMVPD